MRSQSSKSSIFARSLCAGSFFAICLAASAAAHRLNIGDPAPPLRPAAWLKGMPVNSFEKGKVYVVEFWATWCEPCKENIPKLTALSKKMAGKATIIGVDIWEANDPSIVTLPKVKEFVKSEGAAMDYNIAADGSDNQVANAWMKAAGEQGIPTAFIVGKNGIIDWIGNASNLETVLPQVVAGTFDVAAAKDVRDRTEGPILLIQDELKTKQYANVIKDVDAQIKKNPKLGPELQMMRLSALVHTDFPAFEREADAVLKDSQGDIGRYQMICSIFASDKGLPPAAYQYGLQVDHEALQKNERTYLFLAMAAEMSSSLGEMSLAVGYQTQAVDAASKSPNCPKEFLAFLQDNLKRFKDESGS